MASAALVAGFFTLPGASAVGTTTFNPTADSYVQYDQPNTNFGSSVRWSTEGRANIWRNALLRFNVVVPTGEHVVSAKLRAYSEAATTATEFVDVYGTSGSWTESGVTWANAPAHSTWLGKQGNFASGAWVEWDVTSWVGGDGGYSNFKLETNAQKWVGFKSKENTDPALKPQLVVVTEADGTTPPPPPAGEESINAYVTGYSWYDNTPPGSSAISDPVIHTEAAGEGTYADPVTVAVGHSIDPTFMDWAPGTKFYIPNLHKYFIVEDKCGDGATPQNGPCHTGYPAGTTTWLDVWADGRTVTEAEADACMSKLTGAFTVLRDPKDNYVVDSGPIANDPACPVYGNTVQTNPPPVNDGTTAASTQNWGSVVTGDEFNYTGAPDAAKWNVYDSAGHAGQGLRKPSQATVDGTKLNIAGTADGTTAGMSAKFANQKYGRWEVRAAASGDTEYHMVSILWPDSDNWPCEGEVDYGETDGSWSVIKFFLHYSCNNSQVSAQKTLDVTQLHNYAVDWSPTGIKGYVDGVEWFNDTDPSHQPPASMHQTLQLDWFPDSSTNGAAEMRVDWVRVYAASTTTPPPPPPPTGTDYTFGTVGDMNPSGNTSTSHRTGKNAAGIIGALNNGSISNFVALGDLQYEQGSCSSAGAWNTLFGAAKSKMYWITGPNHDVEPGRNDIRDYLNGDCSGTWDDQKAATNLQGHSNTLEWYSFDKGNWHFVMAPTATWRYNATRAAQMTGEMRTNIQAAKAAGKHIIVAYHDPYFTSKTSSHDRETSVKPWIDMWSDEGVKILLSGSQHNYERSCPVNKSDQCVTNGMQQFQVSTGGIGLRSFTSSPSYIVKRFSDTYGWLQMTLKADGSYNWLYHAVEGSGSDSGSRAAQ